MRFFRLIHRAEAICVAIATSVAAGVLGKTDEKINHLLDKVGIGIPVDKLGLYADVAAGTIFVVLRVYGKRKGTH